MLYPKMASSTTFGASIVPSQKEHNGPLLPDPVVDSPSITPVPTHDDYMPGQNVPLTSPFYTHPPASHEVITPTTTHLKTHDVYEKDLESANDAPLTPSSYEEHPFSSKIAVEHCKEDTMWPSKQTLAQRYKAQKQKERQTRGLKGCAPVRERWSALSKRNRLYIKLALAFFFIGIAVAIGVGISVAVKGTYYAGDGRSSNIGQ